MPKPKMKRLLTIMNCVVSFMLAGMATVDIINGNYLMFVADVVIIVCFLVLVCIAVVYNEERNPDNSPPSQQIDLDKDDAA